MSPPSPPQPLVTIGMPVHNVERTILDAVESIRLQTLADWELIIVDDGSTDRTPEILRAITDPRIRVILHRENAGLGQRLNETVALARAKYFARLDGDDVAYPERLATQLEYLRAHEDVDVVGSWMVLLDADRRPFGTWRPPEDHARIAAHTYHSVLLAHPTYFGQHEWFVRNPYAVEYIRAEDQILLMDTAGRSTFANVQKVLVGYKYPNSDIRSSVRRRVAFCANVGRFFIRKTRYLDLLRSLISHAGVTALECFAEVTRLRHRLLVHRVVPLERDDEERWNEVWSAVARTAASTTGGPLASLA